MAALLKRLRARTPERNEPRLLPFIAVVALGAAIGLGLGQTGELQRLEWASYDAFVRRAVTTSSPAPQVLVVAIDENSFSEVKLPWPWPRSLHARLIDSIAAQHPASIAFDIATDVPSASPAEDSVFGAAVRRARTVVLATHRAVTDQPGYTIVQWTDPNDVLAIPEGHTGAVDVVPAPDGIVRSVAYAVEERPTLAAAALGLAGIKVPPDAAQPRLLRFNGAPRAGITTVSYYQALEPGRSLPPGVFTGKHVLVGMDLDVPVTTSADRFPTPVSQAMSGVELHATAADAVLRNRFVADPFSSQQATAALALVLAALYGIMVFMLAPGIAVTMVIGASLALALGSERLLVLESVRVPLVGPVVTALLAASTGSAYRFALINRDRKLIKRAFKNYVAPAIVDLLLEDPSRLKLGGEEYEVSVLFSDLAGFTTLAERLSSAELTAHLSRYFREMIDRLLLERATLDKLIGDAIMAYFGCPIVDPRHAEQACRAALAMQRRMRDLNDEWARLGLSRLETRIGVNSGRVVAGNVGTEGIFNYTVLGDTVNLASRLEGVNKEYRTLTIIGEETQARLKGGFAVRELDWIRVKGKTRPVAIFELLGESGEVDARRGEVLERYAEGLSAYRAGDWVSASASFARALEIDADDGPSATLRSRCDYIIEHGARADWDGVHTMLTK